MNVEPLSPWNESVETQRLLFACAFWVMAGDEEIETEEQEWLETEFGPETASRLLAEFAAMDSDEFFRAFDRASGALTAADKARLAAQIDPWLSACARAGSRSPEAQAIIVRIKRRLFPSAPEVPAEKKPDVEPPAARKIPPPAPEPAPQARAAEPPWRGEAMQGHDSEVTALAYSPDGVFMVSGSEDRTLLLWRLDDSSTETPVLGRHEAGISAVFFSSDNRRIVAGDRAGMLTMREAEDGASIWSVRLRGKGGITALALAPDGGLIAAALEGGAVSLVAMQDGSERAELANSGRFALRAVGFTADGNSILTGGDDGVLRVWDAKTGAALKSLSGHREGITELDVHAGGKLAATSSRDDDVIVWNLETGGIVHRLEGHQFIVRAARFSPDGSLLISVSWDHTVRLWDVATGKKLLAFESEGGGFSCAAFHPSGNIFAAGCSDKLIYCFRKRP